MHVQLIRETELELLLTSVSAMTQLSTHATLILYFDSLIDSDSPPEYKDFANAWLDASYLFQLTSLQ